MQGFILHTQRVRDEDLIVYLLSQKALIRSYRFYGLRHSSILNGYKIDFELEHSVSFLPRLKDTLHLGFSWIMDRSRLLIWQEFIACFYRHLKDIEHCEGFYFELLDEAQRRFALQNPKRVVVDSYVKLLEFEGRLPVKFSCFACDEPLKDEFILLRAFLPSCKKCSFGKGFSEAKLQEFYESKNSAFFDDEEINRLYELIKEGF